MVYFVSAFAIVHTTLLGYRPVTQIMDFNYPPM